MSAALLGVDLGTARIGVAICEGPGLPAVPLTTIRHSTWADDIAALVRLAAERGARRIVVGNPVGMDGRPGAAVKKVMAFVASLRQAFPGDVVAYDERFTTALAAKRLHDLPLKGSKRRRHVDELAAAEILNGYLASGGAT